MRISLGSFTFKYIVPFPHQFEYRVPGRPTVQVVGGTYIKRRIEPTNDIMKRGKLGKQREGLGQVRLSIQS